jgi:hypothetical protein
MKATLIKYLQMPSTWKGIFSLIAGTILLWKFGHAGEVSASDIIGLLFTMNGTINTLANK